MKRRGFLRALLAAPLGACAARSALGPLPPLRPEGFPVPRDPWGTPPTLTADVWAPGPWPLTEEMMREALDGLSMQSPIFGSAYPRTTSPANALKILAEHRQR